MIADSHPTKVFLSSVKNSPSPHMLFV